MDSEMAREGEENNPNGFKELADSEGLLKFDKALATAIMALAKSSVGCSNVKRELELAQRTTLQDGDAAKGRQLLWVMCQKFDLSKEDILNWNLQELMAVKCRDGDLERFSTEWLDALLPYNGQLPPEYLLKDLYENQITQAPDFDETLKMWQYEVKYKNAPGGYGHMVQLVNKFVEETNRDKVKKATHHSRNQSPHRNFRPTGQYYGQAAPIAEATRGQADQRQNERPSPRGRPTVTAGDTRERVAERAGTHVPPPPAAMYPRTLSECNMAKVGICFNWTKEGECPNPSCPWAHSHTEDMRAIRKGGPKRQTTRSPAKGTIKGNNGECFRCGSPDHQARYCPQPPVEQSAPQNTASAYWQNRNNARVTPGVTPAPKAQARKETQAQEATGAQRGRTTSMDSAAQRSQSSQSQFSAATDDTSKSQAIKEMVGPSPSGKKNQTVCETHLIGRCLGGDRCQSWHSDTCRDWKNEKDRKDAKTGEIIKGTGIPCSRGARTEGGTCVFCHRNTTSCSGKPHGEPLTKPRFTKAKGRGATPNARSASPAPSPSGKSGKKKKKKKMIPHGGIGMGKKTRKRKMAQQRRKEIKEELMRAKIANQRSQPMTTMLNICGAAREMMIRVVLLCSTFVHTRIHEVENEETDSEEEPTQEMKPHKTLNRQDDSRRKLVGSLISTGTDLSGINAKNANGTEWDGEFAAK